MYNCPNRTNTPEHLCKSIKIARGQNHPTTVCVGSKVTPNGKGELLDYDPEIV